MDFLVDELLEVEDFALQLLALHLCLIDLVLDAAEDTVIEDLCIIINHQSDVLDLLLLFL